MRELRGLRGGSRVNGTRRVMLSCEASTSATGSEVWTCVNDLQVRPSGSPVNGLLARVTIW